LPTKLTPGFVPGVFFFAVIARRPQGDEAISRRRVMRLLVEIASPR